MQTIALGRLCDANVRGEESLRVWALGYQPLRMGVLPFDDRFSTMTDSMQQDRYVHHVCELAGVAPFLLARDVRPGLVLRAAGVPARVLLDPEGWLPRRQFLALVNALAPATGDPYCVARIAALDPVEKLGALGEAILRAPTLRAALTVTSRRTSLVQTGTLFRLEERGSTARWSFAFLGRTGENPRQYSEGVLAFFRKILAFAAPTAPVTVSFEHPQPRRASELEGILGPDLAFNRSGNALVFDRALLDLPLRHRSDGLSPVPLLADRPREESLLRAVLSEISAGIVYGPVSIRRTAVAVGLHVRTLQRELERWGTTFEAVMDDYRRDHALALVRSGRQTMTEIAFLVGYSDAAHFSRAFRRWTGMAPREYRARLSRSQDPRGSLTLSA